MNSDSVTEVSDTKQTLRERLWVSVTLSGAILSGIYTIKLILSIGNTFLLTLQPCGAWTHRYSLSLVLHALIPRKSHAPPLISASELWPVAGITQEDQAFQGQKSIMQQQLAFKWVLPSWWYWGLSWESSHCTLMHTYGASHKVLWSPLSNKMIFMETKCTIFSIKGLNKIFH